MLTGRGRWWNVVSSSGTAADLHDRPIPASVERLVWSHKVTGPALVLGSTQPEEHVGADASDKAEVVRRRSGGGAVLVQSYDTWIDVLIGSDDRLWDDDVGHAFRWIGEVWAAAFVALGITSPTVYAGPLLHRDEGRVICFAGLGPGEVTDGAGQKLLGLSQRRTRNVARFQCLVPYRSPLAHTIDLLNPHVVPEVDHETLVGAALDPSVLTTAFLAELARLD